ncbi:hypothetical protein QQS21_012090 [Conoideocrella luteorostrata]|uniref:Nudix hydrolase domain-containing protein n=1 Tax=Conoideocrella luteorostrata TaxID=1105319 RepID=A0AAJ0CBV2_9HYPO|nr:hypothetical protein QQS21_012090 [Conoideocrella luteorostrata]
MSPAQSRDHTPLEHGLARRGSALSNNTIPPTDFLMRCAPSQSLMISCGCVLIDPLTRKIAILFDNSTSITQLPKGRKNIGEDIYAAALREAHEETGLSVQPLPLKIPTRATPTVTMMHLVNKSPEGCPEDVTSTVENCEPVAVCHHVCSSTLAYKLVFWYAAQADSTAVPAEGTMEAWEDFQLKWVDARDAAGRMSMAADGDVIEKVLSDMRASGYDI